MNHQAEEQVRSLLQLLEAFQPSRAEKLLADDRVNPEVLRQLALTVSME